MARKKEEESGEEKDSENDGGGDEGSSSYEGEGESGGSTKVERRVEREREKDLRPLEPAGKIRSQSLTSAYLLWRPPEELLASLKPTLTSHCIPYDPALV